MEAATTSARTAPAPKKQRTTDRAKAERKLAWLLCAPAVIAMLLVTGYPIGYAFYLSLQRYDLRFPDEKEFVGLQNYGFVFTNDSMLRAIRNTAGWIVLVPLVAVSIASGAALEFAVIRRLSKAPR